MISMDQTNKYNFLPVYRCDQEHVLGFEVRAMFPVTTLQGVRRQLEFIQKTIKTEPEFAEKKYFISLDISLLTIRNIYLEFIVFAKTLNITVCLPDEQFVQEQVVQSNLLALRQLGISLYLWRMALGVGFRWDGYAVDYLYLHASAQLERMLLHFVQLHDTPLIIRQVERGAIGDIQRISRLSHMVLGVMFR